MPPRRDPYTKDLYAWEGETVAVGYGDDVIGRGPLANRIARLVSTALRDAKEAGKCRNDVGRAMAEYLGRPIPSGSLDKWASEAAEDHRIPLDAFVAMIHATGQTDMLAFIPSLFGFAVVPNRFVDLIELHQLEEHEREVQARKAALQAKVRGARR